MEYNVINSTSTCNEMAVIELEKSLMDCSDLFDQSIHVLSDVSNRAMIAGSSLNSLRIWDDRTETTATARYWPVAILSGWQVVGNRVSRQSSRIC